MELVDMVERVAAHLLDHFELDFDTHNEAALSAAYNIVSELEDTTRRAVSTASEALVEIAQMEKVPEEHVSGILFAAGFLATEADRPIELLPPGEITTANFLPDPLEDTQLGDVAPFEESDDVCGDSRELVSGEYVICNRPPHQDGHWHMEADDENEINALWRGNEEVYYEHADVDGDDDDE